MNNVTAEQIKQAKDIDILAYLLAHEPHNIKRVGREYRLKDHDSLTISNGWFHWHSRGVGGSNVIDYLTKVRGYGFVEAMRSLVGVSVPACSAVQEGKPRTFILPACNHNNDKVIAYLRKRGIALSVIQDCIRRGSLYEDTRHNCVFVGFDEGGKPRYAALRGTYGDFKRDAAGSDKRFNFLLSTVNPHSYALAVFESPIDALSHQTLCPEFNDYRLSLGGVALAALERFLTTHSHVCQVFAGTDNDEAGEQAAARIAALPNIDVLRLKPPKGKDWADAARLR
jgi:hypothetical protein